MRRGAEFHYCHVESGGDRNTHMLCQIDFRCPYDSLLFAPANRVEWIHSSRRMPGPDFHKDEVFPVLRDNVDLPYPTIEIACDNPIAILGEIVAGYLFGLISLVAFVGQTDCPIKNSSQRTQKSASIASPEITYAYFNEKRKPSVEWTGEMPVHQNPVHSVFSASSAVQIVFSLS
jgi:hypothetical protein